MASVMQVHQKVTTDIEQIETELVISFHKTLHITFPMVSCMLFIAFVAAE